MRIGIYNPYFDGFGGGERYTFTLASHWSKSHDVFLFWESDAIRKIAEYRFNIDLSRVKTTQNFFRSRNLLKKALCSKQYDLIFFLSDGSIPTSFATYNILHFQVPFARVSANSLKLRQYQAVVCNSQFTKKNLDPRLSKQATIIYPPVDTLQFHSIGRKEKIILSVGRFTSYFQAKKQEVLIEAWKDIEKERSLVGWTLILAGGLLPSDQTYFESLQKNVSGLSVQLLPNISFEELRSLYSRASVYWHAAGFGEHDPKFMEHFGITTVEAMAAGCIPLVYDGGGLPEIVRNETDGFLWKTREELIDKTAHTIAQSALLKKMCESAKQRAKAFDKTKFFYAFDQLLDSII